MKHLYPNTYKTAYLFIVLSMLASPFANASNTTATNTETIKGNKGLFSIQFSWNNASFDDLMRVQVQYKKKGLLTKKKGGSGSFVSAGKDTYLNIELAEGDYEFLEVQLQNDKSIPTGKYLKLAFDGSFSIKAGQVTTGGMIFLVRQNKQSFNIIHLKIDNSEDVKRYVSTYKRDYASKVNPAWEFLPKETVDKMVSAYAAQLIKRESASKRPKVQYTYSTLGIVLKMKKDLTTGKVLDYKLIPTSTYQQIRKMSLKKEGKIMCELRNDMFLYGDDDALPFMPLPKSLVSYPEIHELDDTNFLMIDRNRNLYTADNTFNWKDHTEFSSEYEESFFQARTTRTEIYKGPRHLYVYTTGIGKNKLLLQSSYGDFDFTEVQLSKDIKKIPLVTETSTQIIIGPVLKVNYSAKRPGFIYVKTEGSDTWQEHSLPFGDCYNFAPDKKDETIFYTKCKESEWHRSYDSGKTWEPFKVAGTN